MPIEIRELHIKAVVNNNEGQRGTTNAKAQANEASQGSPDKEAFIAECVERVMQIMELKKEF